MDERRDPGETEPEACAPGSIEQQLDMCETGTLRGDEITHSHGNVDEDEGDTEPQEPLDQVMNRFDLTAAETDREGSELSGDEHSVGQQGMNLPGDGGANSNSDQTPEAVDNSDEVRHDNDDNVIIFRQRGPKEAAK